MPWLDASGTICRHRRTTSGVSCRRPQLTFMEGIEQMAKNSGIALAVVAMGLYIFGGVLTFIGLYLIIFMHGSDFFGWGEGRSLGYLFLCVGLSLSIIGVLFMRIFRNRGLS